MSDGALSRSEVEQLRRATPSYAAVGGTKGALPAGYHHLDRRVVIGAGVTRFHEAVERLLGWEMHRRAGLSVRPSSDRIGDGVVAVLRLGWGPVAVDAPVRVVYVVDEARRRGFAYGTLPGHPESGEEAFVVELGDDDAVVFRIRAFSRPASVLARLGGPLGRAVQAWVTRRYLRAL